MGRPLLVAVAMLALPGCVAPFYVHRGPILPVKEWSVHGGVSTSNRFWDPGESYYMALVDLAVGVGHDTELTVRLSTVDPVSVGARVRLVEGSGLALDVGPRMGWYHFQNSPIQGLNLHLPVVVSLSADTFDVYLAGLGYWDSIRTGKYYTTNLPDRPVMTIGAGGAIGLRVKMGSLVLIPEMSVLAPIRGQFLQVVNYTSYATPGPVWQIGLGVGANR